MYCTWIQIIWINLTETETETELIVKNSISHSVVILASEPDAMLNKLYLVKKFPMCRILILADIIPMAMGVLFGLGKNLLPKSGTWREAF